MRECSSFIHKVIPVLVSEHPIPLKDMSCVYAFFSTDLQSPREPREKYKDSRIRFFLPSKGDDDTLQYATTQESIARKFVECLFENVSCTVSPVSVGCIPFQRVRNHEGCCATRCIGKTSSCLTDGTSLFDSCSDAGST